MSLRLNRRRMPVLEILDERVLMAADPLMPKPTTDELKDVFFVGNATYPAPPTKTITITNNTDQTVFPILRDANTGQATNGNFYDPIDNHNQEYRGYVGYTQGGVNYFGLPAHTTVTMTVPLVFWDGANVYFATDGRDLQPPAGSTANPFQYDPKSVRAIKPAASGGSAVVMWYTVYGDLAHTPSPDAPAQLTEFTIRDPYLSNFNIPGDQLIQLINYDVSYVDSNTLTVAMEANGVPIPNTTAKADYGWIGSTLTQTFLQSKIADFAANAGNELGQYFDGNGWPVYYNPYPNDGVKIPSGANIFANSPLNDTRSSFNNVYYALSSGGPGPLVASANGKIGSASNVIHVNFNTDADRDAFFTVLANADKNHQTFYVRDDANPSVVIGKVTSYQPDANDTGGDVGIDRPAALDPSKSYSLDFYRPVTDYAATRIRDLWYAWANYYVTTFTGTQQTLPGTLADGSNVLQLAADPQGAVALGMGVSGPGVRPGTTVLGFGKSDPSQILLSQLPSGAGAGPYVFTPPTPIPYASEATPLTLSFAKGPAADEAKKFAASVYEAMAAEAAIPIPVPPRTTPPILPKSLVLVGTVIGADILHLPNHDDSIGGSVRDLIKSVLRGVYDFNKVDVSKWYPDPSLATGGLKYNAYNLDPYVWFVHQKLGLSGYGFSVDDDTADVGANGTDTLQFVVSGKDGLKNRAEWFPSLPWGGTTALARVITQPGGPTLIQLLSPVQYQQIRPDDDANGLKGAYVWGANLAPGTNLKAYGPLDQLIYILSNSSGTSSGTQYVTLYFTGKNTPPLLGLRPAQTPALVAAADRFQSRALTVAAPRALAQLELAYIRDVRPITLSEFKTAPTPADRRALRLFAAATNLFHAQFRYLLDHHAGLARLKGLVQRYNRAVQKL